MLYPQQNDIRNVLDLSGFWDFGLDPDHVGEEQCWFDHLPAPRTIAVPASWNELFQDTRDYLSTAWYQRRTYLPQGWRGQRVYLRVGSANYAARVWVNGQHVGSHEGGHLPFALDVTEHVTWDAPNTISIAVENELKATRVPPGGVRGAATGGFMAGYPDTNYDFFPYAGIQRPVILYGAPEEHIADVTVVTEVMDDSSLIRATVVQSGALEKGRIVLRGEGVELDAGLRFADGIARAEISVPAARLWCPADPYLYELEITLLNGERVADRYTLDVGIRTVAVEGDQLLLNGGPVFLKGFGKHEDFCVHGRGLNVPLIVKDNALLKWVGANSYRTSHYPYSEEAMRLADREGILIVDEIPAVGLFFEDGEENIQARLTLCRQQLRELVARDKNHPSVIMWSVANEPFPPEMIRRFTGSRAKEGSDELGRAFLADLFELVHELDPTRPATFAAVMGCPLEWMSLADVVFINRYWGWYTQSGQLDAGAHVLAQELDNLHETLKKPIVISEFGADTIAGMHADPPEMWTEEYQVEMLRRYLDVAVRRPFVIGLHVWNFADFKTGQSTARVGGMNRKGVFTRDRRPKMAAHFLRERWAEPAAAAPVQEPVSAPTTAQPDIAEGFAAVARRLDGVHPGMNAAIKFDLGEGRIYRLVFENGACRVEPGESIASCLKTVPAVSSRAMARQRPPSPWLQGTRSSCSPGSSALWSPR